MCACWLSVLGDQRTHTHRSAQHRKADSESVHSIPIARAPNELSGVMDAGSGRPSEESNRSQGALHEIFHDLSLEARLEHRRESTFDRVGFVSRYTQNSTLLTRGRSNVCDIQY
jgi:hypothetical protein